jgi:hypothetical protein
LSYACPVKKCGYNKILEKGQGCPECVRTAEKFDETELNNLFAMKAEYQEFKKTGNNTPNFQNAGMKVNGKVAALLGVSLLTSMILVLYNSGNAIIASYSWEYPFNQVFNVALMQFVAFILLYLFLWVTFYYVSRKETA